MRRRYCVSWIRRRSPAAWMRSASRRAHFKGFGPSPVLDREWCWSPARPGAGRAALCMAPCRSWDRTQLNVVTLEDPVEYRADDVTQIQVDRKAGLTFPAALRAVLRQDPDVILVGEIRDRETAEIAMAAAITGHLVLSTIHTPDAASALDRLAQMGVPRYLIAGGVTGVVAQRLVRTGCRSCDARGCPRCVDGYRGRVGVFEVLTMNDRMREEVVREAQTLTLRRLALEGGMTSMLEDARRKVAERITTPHEVARVLRDDPGTASACASCGTPLPYGALGCAACGRSRRRVCRCDRTLRDEWRYCPWCLRRTGA